MLNLFYGGYTNYTRPELRKVPITSRTVGNVERSSRWKGVQHGELVDALHDVMKERFGWEAVPDSETYAVSPNGAAVVGGFDIGTVPDKKVRNKSRIKPLRIDGLNQNVNQSVGFIHSNDSRRALRLSIGGRVLLCENGMVIGDYTSGRRHTSGLNLKDWLEDSFQTVYARLHQVGNAAQLLSDIEVNPRFHDAALLHLGRNNILPWKHLPKLDNAWDNAVSTGQPDWLTEENADQDWGFDNSVWDWYNAFTHIAKQTPAVEQFDVLRQGFETCGELIPAKKRKELNALVSDN